MRFLIQVLIVALVVSALCDPSEGFKKKKVLKKVGLPSGASRPCPEEQQLARPVELVQRPVEVVQRPVEVVRQPIVAAPAAAVAPVAASPAVAPLVKKPVSKKKVKKAVKKLKPLLKKLLKKGKLPLLVAGSGVGNSGCNQSQRCN